MGLICKCLIILISGQINHCRSTGVCSREKSAVSNNGLIYFQDQFCCDNFERHGDGNCYDVIGTEQFHFIVKRSSKIYHLITRKSNIAACPKGFTSKARFACTPCLKGTYGFRCADNCKCEHSERCDHVNGCVLRHKADTLSTANSFTRIIRTQNDVNNYQTSTLHMSSHETSKRSRNELHNTLRTSPKSKEDTINGFIDQKVLTYMLMAVAGALVVVMGLCLCLICVCWKRHMLSKKRSIPSSSSAFPLTKFPDMEDDTLGAQETSVYGYEEIDEAKMEREIPVIQNDIISISSLKKDSGDSDGYLHPYHSLVSINSNSCKGLDDQHNTDKCEERSYLELSAAKQYLELSSENQCNNEVQQKETCEKDHETMYEGP